MKSVPPEKNCPVCGKPLKGRSDKKFCDDYCRNAHHNALKAADSNLIRHINNALRKNRRILQTCFGKDQPWVKVKRETLLLPGFCFQYITHSFRSKQGNTYYFCYEYGYLPLSDDWYLVVKKEETA